MERLAKLKPLFHAIRSYCRSRVAPNAFVGKRLSKCKVDQVADSLIGERFIKRKPHLPLIHQNLAKYASFSSSSYVRPTYAPKPAGPFSSGSKRFFSRGNTEEKEARVEGLIGLLACLLMFGLGIAVVLSSLEEVPYTHRHIPFPDSENDRKLGEKLLKKKEELEFKGTILPSTHPLSVKVCFILKQLLDALHRDLGLDDTPGVSYHGSDEPYKKGRTAFSFKEIKREFGEWRRDKSGLRGMNWQVLVADKPEKEAYTLGGGIIVVSSGLLDHHSDVWIASVLAHEVGHSVARHVSQFLRFSCDCPNYVSMSDLEDKYQRIEKEASYIGSQLLASAGYDPNVSENLEINYSECEENGPISLEETYTTHVAQNVYRPPYRRYLEARYIGSQLMASVGYDPHVYENLEINFSETEGHGLFSSKELMSKMKNVPCITESNRADRGILESAFVDGFS